jgi:predicted glycosyltransferase
MRILVDIGHPAHVHFFKHFVWEMEKKGHEILIAAKDKEVSLQLLDAYGLKYVRTGSYRKGLALKVIDMLRIDWNTFKVAKGFKPDILMSLGSPNAAHVSWLLRKPHIAFENTEHSREQYYLYAPFTTAICTPSCFKRDLGRKHIRFDGYKELAYLHPNYFKPDPSVLSVLSLAPGERLVVMRFVAFQATHDAAAFGFSIAAKRRMVETFRTYGRVVITSESELPEDLRQYQLRVSPEQLHSVLFYADLYVGDAGATSVEAALLGTPAVHFARLPRRGRTLSATDLHGSFWDMQNRYGLLYSFTDEEAALSKAVELLHTAGAKKVWKSKVDSLLAEKIDVTAFMTWIVGDYPASIRHVREDLNIQERFRHG